LEIPVEISHVSRDHPDENTLEDYVFGRLSEPKTAVLEEHILICERCQAALEQTDEYIRLMKFAASHPLEIPRLRGSKRPALTTAGILAAACIAVFSWFRPHATPVSVTLVSSRGGAAASANQAAAGHPLELSISAADVPPAAEYDLEMVTSAGESIWSGPASSRNGKLSAHVAKSLRAGGYWVRLYTQSSELLAEYGLQVQ
jgi:anti-sigma factor RsiW